MVDVPRRVSSIPSRSRSLILFFVQSIWWVWQTKNVECAGQPEPAQFYTEQLIDHWHPDDQASSNCSGSKCGNNCRYWTQRYYTSDEFFQGPGSPIFLIFGGEGAIEPATGIMYPFISQVLAKRFGAYVLQPEHRFYGSSQPISRAEIDEFRNKGLPDPRTSLFTSEQALKDAFRLLDTIKVKLGCDVSASDNCATTSRFLRFNMTIPEDNTKTRSSSYCPVITVGGSYPGFLSALARIAYPDKVDMAYAGSAPMKYYAQQVDANAYYDHITSVAEKAQPGCANSVKKTLLEIVEYATKARSNASVTEIASDMGFCPDTVPDYIVRGRKVQMLLEETFMVVGYTFANDNMAYYPPVPESRLATACRIFMQENLRAPERLKQYLSTSLNRNSSACVNMSDQVPSGPRGTISGGDWSGVGTGLSGESWDFQTCTLCVEAISFGPNSMFPFRPWTLDWLYQHCQDRFGVTPEPLALNELFHLDTFWKNASRILFTNGLNDGWSVSGIQESLSDTLIAMNFPNGAHHSDLSRRAPNENDTDDLKAGFARIEQLLGSWLQAL